MGPTKEYDPQRNALSWNGLLIGGYMDGTMIRVERNEDTWSVHVGAQGEVTRVRNRNRTGKVTVTLKQDSSSNALLSEQLRIDERASTAFGPLQLVQLDDNQTLVDAALAWIVKPPTMEYAKELSGREWVFECADLNMFQGSPEPML